MGALVIQNMKKKMHKSYILQFVLLICLACCARGDANVCQIQTDQIDSGCRFQEPLDMNNFQIPEGFNLDAVVEAVTKGAGWIKLEQMYSAADVERAKEVVYHHNQADKRNVTLNKHKHETRRASCRTSTTPTTGPSIPPPTTTSWTRLLTWLCSLSPSCQISPKKTAARASGPTHTTSPATPTTWRTSTPT